MNGSCCPLAYSYPYHSCFRYAFACCHSFAWIVPHPALWFLLHSRSPAFADRSKDFESFFHCLTNMFSSLGSNPNTRVAATRKRIVPVLTLPVTKLQNVRAGVQYLWCRKYDLHYAQSLLLQKCKLSVLTS